MAWHSGQWHGPSPVWRAIVRALDLATAWARRLAGCGIAFFLAACGADTPEPPDGRPEGALRFATHNVHFIRADRAHGRWSLADWETRKQALDATFKALDADVIAFQEMVSITSDADRSVNHARDWLLARNPEYGLAASGDWRSFPSRQPIFFRRDRLELRDQGWFFFDPPELLAEQRRRPGFWLYFATWAEFEDRAGRVFRVYNVHFDYLDAARRRHAAQRVADHVRPLIDAGIPVVVMGDTNALPGWGALRVLEARGLSIVHPPGSTYHFNVGLDLLGPIDRIVHGPRTRVLQGPWAVRTRHAAVWPSDHYPVVADLLIP